MSNFDRAFKELIGHEGGYVSAATAAQRGDPGGETKYGITKRSYPTVNISALTLDGAKAIYRRDFWDRCRCDDMPYALAYATFDVAVNSGIRAAGLDLQRSLVRVGQRVTVDGIIGPASGAAIKAACKSKAGAKSLTRWMLAHRGVRFGNIARTNGKNWDSHALGWMARLVDLAQLAEREG